MGLQGNGSVAARCSLCEVRYCSEASVDRNARCERSCSLIVHMVMMCASIVGVHLEKRSCRRPRGGSPERRVIIIIHDPCVDMARYEWGEKSFHNPAVVTIDPFKS